LDLGLCIEIPILHGFFQHAISDRPEHRIFDPAVTALQTYQDDEYQPVYYVAESIGDAMNRLRSTIQQLVVN
jgi:tyrosine 3-monooxygenase